MNYNDFVYNKLFVLILVDVLWINVVNGLCIKLVNVWFFIMYYLIGYIDNVLLKNFFLIIWVGIEIKIFFVRKE